MDEWISVDEKLPDGNDVYDTIDMSTDNPTKLSHVYYSPDEEMFYIDHDLTDVTEYVTHWKILK